MTREPSRTVPELAAVLRAPPGGEWVRVDAGPLGAPLRCVVDGVFVQTGWRYMIGLKSHISICDDCVDRIIEEERTP